MFRCDPKSSRNGLIKRKRKTSIQLKSGRFQCGGLFLDHSLMPSCTSVTSAGSPPVGQSNDPSIRFSFSGSGQSHREAKLASRRVVSTNCAVMAKKLQCFQSTLCWREIARWQVLVQRHQFRAFPQSFLHQMVRGHYSKTLRWQSPSGK